MYTKKAPNLYWFLCLINFSVKKLFWYFAVKSPVLKIKDSISFNFICLYKRKGVFLLMVFDISNLDLNFNNLNNELPCELFDVIKDTIDETSVVCPEYVIGNHFTDNSQMSLSDFGFFFTFRNGKTLQSDIENYMSNFKIGIDPFSKTIFKQTTNVY